MAATSTKSALRVAFEDTLNGVRAYVVDAPELSAIGPGRHAAFFELARLHGAWFGVEVPEWPEGPQVGKLIPALAPEVIPLGALGIEFEAFGAKSPYDALLDKLAASPADWALRLSESSNALRAALHARGKRKGLALLFGERNGALYVRINYSPNRSAKRAETNATAVLRVLKGGPATFGEIRRATDRSSNAIARALDRMRVRGHIETEGDKFVLVREGK